jgi:broad specificity phosphatase PhoE
MTHIYLIRHGRTAWNHSDRLQGWADEPLDAVGLAQAASLAGWLADTTFDAIYSSPLRRARQTAEIMARPHGLPVRFDDRLRERNVGEWTGLTLDEARARAPERFLDDWREIGAPGGEGQAALAGRVAAALDDIVVAHPEGTVAVVSHGGSLSAALAHVLGIPTSHGVSFSFHNTAIARLIVRPNSGGLRMVRLISLGDDRHLQGVTEEPPAM